MGVKFNYGVPHSEGESIPKVLKGWFGDQILNDDQLVELSVGQLKEIMKQMHQEGKIRQKSVQGNTKLPPII